MKLARFLALFVLVATTCRVVLFRLPDFDGAFNAQAALNLYRHGKLLLDYASPYFLQTNLPFQVINGFFLWICGASFLAFNLANVLFYFGLFEFTDQVSRRFGIPDPWYAFCALSLYPNFFVNGFSGFGEVPFLVLLLWSVWIFINHRESKSGYLYSSVLYGLACATKYIAFLSVIPCILLLWLQKCSRRQAVLVSAFAFITFIFCSLLQYAQYPGNALSYMTGAIIDQNMPLHSLSPYVGAPVASYLDRVALFMTSFLRDETLEISLFVLGLLCVSSYASIRDCFRTGHSENKRNRLALFLLFYAWLYFAWYFFIGTRPWDRRYLDGVALIIYGVSIGSPFKAYLTKSWMASLPFLPLFLGWGAASANNFSLDPKMIVTRYEETLKEALALLPSNFVGYGYLIREAPRWSLVAHKRFYDIYQFPAFSDCIGEDKGCQNKFLFLDGSRRINPEAYMQIMDKIQSRQIWSAFVGDDTILQLKGLDTSKLASIKCNSRNSEDSKLQSSIQTISGMLNDDGLHLGGEAAVTLTFDEGWSGGDLIIAARSLNGPSALKTILINDGERHVIETELSNKAENIVITPLHGAKDSQTLVYLVGGVKKVTDPIQYTVLIQSIQCRPQNFKKEL